MKEAIIIGVDFGTTFSGVAWVCTVVISFVDFGSQQGSSPRLFSPRLFPRPCISWLEH